jgi:ATP/maltotriose-dependent transcriptional regulator MalT/two-component SAPR family response regulator
MKAQSIRSQKFSVPRAAHFHLSRGRLLDLVRLATENKLTIISAPPGYGKTSLLADFAGKTNYPICWYELESTDNKLIKFVDGFISCIHHRFPKFGLASLAALKTSSSQKIDGRTFAAVFLNDLKNQVDEHFVIILDDFQLVDTNVEINEFINNILIESDENLHVIVSSRALLSLPDLPLLVARSQVGGLSYEELSFTKEEIKDLLLLIQKRSISDSEADTLLKNCEGWVMGLLLSSYATETSLKKNLLTLTSKDINVNDFLAMQVLEAQPESIQHFLLRSSLFDQFDIELFSKVMKKAGLKTESWEKFFKHVIEQNLFVIPVGKKINLYRYHHLLLEFLRGIMHKKYPDETKKILTALAEYYEKSREWSKAFNLYNEVGLLEKNIQLIIAAAPEMIGKGQIHEIEEWLINIPQKEVEKSPGLLSTWGVIATIHGDSKEGTRYFNDALKIINLDQDRSLAAITYNRRANVYRLTGDYENCLKDADRALQVCREDIKLSIWSADARFIKGTCYSFMGEWEKALIELDQSHKQYSEMGEKDSMAKCLMQIGFILKSTGHYISAFENYKKALKHYQVTKNIIWETSVLNNLGVLAHIRCEFREAIEYFEKAIEYANLTKNRRMESYVLASIGDLYADLGANLEALDAYERSFNRSLKEADNYLLPYLEIAMAKIEPSERATVDLLGRASQRLNSTQNVYQRHELELEEGVLSLKKTNNENGFQKIIDSYDYFAEHEQKIDAIVALSSICWCLVSRSSLIKTNRYIEDIETYIEDPDFAKYLILQVQKNGLTRDELENVLSGWSYKSRSQTIWDEVALVKAKAKQYIRRRGSVVPLRPAKISIRCFGRTIVSRAGETITNTEWKSQTARDLFIYIAINHISFTKEEIGEIFWPESSFEDLKLRFKNTIYRLRRAIGKDVIHFEGDRYEYNRSIDLESDYDDFIEEINNIENKMIDNDEIISYLRAVKIFKGPFLIDVDMEWANHMREELSQKYFRCLIKLASRYVESEKYEEGLKFALKACEFDALSEFAHQLAMRAYAGLGDRSSIIRQYQKIEQNLKNELQIEPSTATIKLYKLLTT